jgi:hypothetical protein
MHSNDGSDTLQKAVAAVTATTEQRKEKLLIHVE